MARTRKIQTVSSELKNRCRNEEALSIRELLDTLYENGLTHLTKTTEQHRFRQGYLQALDDIDAIISKP